MSARIRRQYAAYCKTYGNSARERGRANETRLLAAVLGLMAGASWILDARASSPEEDAAGADVVVIADVGELYLQSKSSNAGLRKFASSKRSINAEAVAVSLDDATTAARTILALSALRQEKMRPAPRPIVVDVRPKAKPTKAPRARAPGRAQQLAYEIGRRTLPMGIRCPVCDLYFGDQGPWESVHVDRGPCRKFTRRRSLCPKCCAEMDDVVAELNGRACATEEAA